jgi:hypothetical protein
MALSVPELGGEAPQRPDTLRRSCPDGEKGANRAGMEGFRNGYPLGRSRHDYGEWSVSCRYHES